jgi:hypothetical protein
MFGKDVMGTGFIVETAALLRAQKFVTIKRRGVGLWVVFICPTTRAEVRNSGEEITAVVRTI